jgi:hypothetical protein
MEEAYTLWLQFIQEMEPTENTINWADIGTSAFRGSERITTLWGNRTTTDIDVYTKYCKCIWALIFVKHFPKTFPPDTSLCYWSVKTYHGLELARRPLTELRTLAHQNYVYECRESDSVIVLALAILGSRRWGFNTFAVKSPMNDDILAHIRSYVY